MQAIPSPYDVGRCGVFAFVVAVGFADSSVGQYRGALYVMPVAAIAGWLIDPPQSCLSLRKALLWLCFPLAYVVYSLVRGTFAHWYPYPFLSPDIEGYGGVFLNCLVIFIGFIVVAWGVVAAGKLLRAQGW
jgi:hypothetical protein